MVHPGVFSAVRVIPLMSHKNVFVYAAPFTTRRQSLELFMCDILLSEIRRIKIKLPSYYFQPSKA